MGGKIQNGLVIAGAVMTVLTGMIGTHQYLASSQGGWLTRWVSPETLSVVSFFVWVALPWVGIFMARTVSRALREEAKQREADRVELARQTASLETRMWEGINKALLQVREPIESQLSGIEARLAKLDPTAHDFAKAALSGDPDSYQCLTPGGTIQRFTRTELTELLMKNPDAYYQLKDLNKDLERWHEDAL
jgi:hypothetical protein